MQTAQTTKPVRSLAKGEKKMRKAELIRRIEESGKYCKVRISTDGDVTGMLVDEDYRYHKATNTGGRRYIGRFGEAELTRQYS
jgi:fructose-1,6-bisphosphatase/sedoheptulose 1,7-bisphosphatase-like protein